jgi:hypothetical protein
MIRRSGSPAAGHGSGFVFAADAISPGERTREAIQLSYALVRLRRPEMFQQSRPAIMNEMG